MSRPGFILLIMILLVLPIGSISAQGASFAIDTLPNGAAQVQNRSPGIWDEGTRWSLEEVFRIGTLEGGGPDQFGSVTDIGADSMGMVYVVDALALEVRVFDSLGAYSHSVGGKGEGPGEFRGPLFVSVSPNGRLWAEDLGNARYSVFSPSGEYETGYRREVVALIIPSMSGFSPERGYVDWVSGRTPGENRPSADGAWSVYHPVVFSPPAQYDTMPPLTVWRENASDGRRSPRAESLLTHVSSKGDLWFAKGSEYKVFRRSLEGDTTLVITLDATAAEWSSQERDSLLADYASHRRPELRDSDIPRRKPIVQKIFSDRAGHVFVMPQVPGVEAGTVVDVFQESGEYLGRLQLPEEISFRTVSPVVGRDRIYALIFDEYDVSYVVGWRFVKP